MPLPNAPNNERPDFWVPAAAVESISEHFPRKVAEANVNQQPEPFCNRPRLAPSPKVLSRICPSVLPISYYYYD